MGWGTQVTLIHLWWHRDASRYHRHGGHSHREGSCLSLWQHGDNPRCTGPQLETVAWGGHAPWHLQRHLGRRSLPGTIKLVTLSVPTPGPPSAATTAASPNSARIIVVPSSPPWPCHHPTCPLFTSVAVLLCLSSCHHCGHPLVTTLLSPCHHHGHPLATTTVTLLLSPRLSSHYQHNCPRLHRGCPLVTITALSAPWLSFLLPRPSPSHHVAVPLWPSSCHHHGWSPSPHTPNKTQRPRLWRHIQRVARNSQVS